MALVKVFNPGRTPVLLDSAGRTLGAGERRTADDSDSVTAHGIKTRQIIVVRSKKAGA